MQRLFSIEELVYVHPNKAKTEEYCHLHLEQCKCVHKDLVNQYKSFAKKIDERILWSELDNTHTINYPLSVTN